MDAITMSANINVPTLKQHEVAIEKLLDTAKKNIFEICVRLAIIDGDETCKEELQEMGYKNTADYSAAVFGLARSTTLNYIKIAKQYLTVKPLEGKKKKIEITTICAETDENGNTSDYKIGQLNALGKTTAGDFEIMHQEGVISPDMSADAIRKAVTAWYAPEPEEEQETEPEEEQESEPEEEQEPMQRVENLVKEALDIVNYKSLPGELATALQSVLTTIYELND